MGGLRLDFLLGRRLHPYGDFLFGRGEMKYAAGGYNFSDYTYLVSTTYIYSPGAGFDFDLSSHFAIKVDGQYQIWDGPTASGKVRSGHRNHWPRLSRWLAGNALSRNLNAMCATD